MSSSHSLPLERVTPPPHAAGQLAYGALFVVLLPLALIGWAMAMDRHLSLPLLGSPAIGFMFASIGAAIIVAAVIALRVKGGGWPMSPYPPERLVTSGIYAIVAHPLYLGSVLVAFGMAMASGSGSGIWIVTPVLAAACIAFVWGYERERTIGLFGRTPLSFLRLPARSDARPDIASRLSVYFLALLPWFIIYEGINRLPTPAGAIAVTTRWDLAIPVIGWTELIYFAAYPLVLLAPLLAARKSDLRDLTIRAWVATAGSALVYLTVPVTFPVKLVPDTVFAPMLEWERAFNASATALPAFHVIWPMLVLPRSRWRWPVTISIAVSCLTTGMHAIADVVAGLILGLLFVHGDAVWRALTRGAEWLAESRAETRIGRVRLINHGLYAAAAVGSGIAIIVSLTGDSHRLSILFITAASIAGAALWAQWVEGSSSLLRPFGYYGGLIGAVLAIAIFPDRWLLLAAFGVAAPVIQALGRLRCLVQGCCHGRPAAHGMRVSDPRSRIVRIAGLGGVPIHPTQLYSIALNLAFAALLLRLWIAGAELTFIAGSYFILTGLGRFVEEHYRGEPQTKVVAGMRLYQWMSIGNVVAGAFLMAIPSAAAPSAQPLSAGSIAVAVAAFVVSYFIYGADLPESNRRFARLT
jgi:protein-S-isoprenylcysteine O-methyltransferase Ste14